MDNFTLFICGIVVTLIAGMGVITSEVFLGYHKYVDNLKKKIPEITVEEEEDEYVESTV